MIKESFIEIIGHGRNKKYYADLGYDIRVGETISVRTLDLKKGSAYKITTICQNCFVENQNTFKDYFNYTVGLKEPYYCVKCKKIKSEKTNLEKWGCKNPMQNEQVKEKLKSSLLEKYGVDWYSKTEEWKKKFKKTSFDRWGVDNPSRNPEIINEIRDKNIEHITSSEFREVSKNKKQRNTWKKYASMLPTDYQVINYDSEKFTIKNKNCQHQFEILKSLLYSRLKSESIICLECNPIDIQESSFEIEVGDFLKELGINFEKRNRKILNGIELDYYIPEYNLAIECNGIFWHNELFKNKNYHLNKTNLCRERKIKLLHIWEDDWYYKKEIVKSIIKSKLGLIGNKIYARNCIISQINSAEYKKFLDENHIQGYASSSYKIGLYHNGDLVSVMTFGFRRTNNKREYELIRFCNKISVSVVGSASKLFRHFVSNNQDIEQIVSYSDISIFTGNIYKILGFDLVSLSEPNYFWVVNGKRVHRYNFSKRKLVKSGFDPNKTEVEIMNDRGYWRIFSTGQEKWIFKKGIG